MRSSLRNDIHPCPIAACPHPLPCPISHAPHPHSTPPPRSRSETEMDLFNSTAFTRREFLSRGVTLASAAATIPYFLQSSAFGLPMPEWGCSSIPGAPEDHILVVVQLSGGNDGLN